MLACKQTELAQHSAPAGAHSRIVILSLHCRYTSPNIYRALADTQQSAWMKPGTKVYYKISATGVSSPTYSFMLPPATGALNNVKLAVIGDLGQTTDSISTVQHVLTGTVQAPAGTRPYDAVLIAGDLSYADAENFAHCSHPGGCVPQRWDSYGQMYQQLGTVVPTFTTPGNHEIELVSVGDLAAAPAGCNVTTIPFLEYRARWFHYRTTTPEALHYSFDIGNVHAVMLNSYVAPNLLYFLLLRVCACVCVCVCVCVCECVCGCGGGG
jgi:hypothetical protein